VGQCRMDDDNMEETAMSTKYHHQLNQSILSSPLPMLVCAWGEKPKIRNRYVRPGMTHSISLFLIIRRNSLHKAKWTLKMDRWHSTASSA
jgi:hypothetical protein